MQSRLLVVDVRGGDDFICAGVIEEDFDLLAEGVGAADGGAAGHAGHLGGLHWTPEGVDVIDWGLQLRGSATDEI